VNVCESYFLTDNPFPATPILDPNSDDDRVNGRIYNPHIREAEIQSFESKIRQRLPLIYIENSVFERGVGKSALLVQQWRQLQSEPNVTSLYIRSKENLKPSEFVARLIDRWHHDGYLWPAILRTMDMYIKEYPKGDIPRAGVEHFKERFPDLPKRPVSLSSFNVFNPKLLINDLAALAHQEVGDNLHIELARIFFECYLTDPTMFLDSYPTVLRKQRWDDITMLAGIYRLLKLGGYQYHYLFFDQFEDAITGLTGKALISFNTQMRRLIEASMNQATITITLHPGAAQALATHEGGDIRSLAPHDSRYVVDVLPLTKEGTHQLAQTYLGHYRLPSAVPPDSLFPFTPEAVNTIHTASRGNIRSCLQAFNYAVVCGVEAGCVPIDGEFLVEHHAEITGRVHPEDINL
jgi:hypothetical protein